MPAPILPSLVLAAMLAANGAADPVRPPAAPTPVGSMGLHADGNGRMQADVLLDGRGPFRFTVDSAATGVAISQALAARLGLRTGGATQVTGGIGHGSSQTVAVDTLRTDLFDLRGAPLPALPGLAADGVLGMAPFAHGRIELDLTARTLIASPSAPTPAGFAAIAGELRHGILIVDVRIDGVPAKALVDTGAPYDIGNPQLQAALGLTPGDARLSPGGTFADGFGQERMVEQATPARIDIGAVTFARPAVRFADMPVFRTLGLDDGPALILGMDQLSRMGAIAIDFPRAELQLRP
ncbi:MAG: retroviral-like aspartic protease family protein [Proteobacteria bacterium]|nr:retroviral-like aspartic protease family protein [Pseudomonadota bacterium]